MAKVTQHDLLLPLRDDYELTDGAAAQLAELAQDATVYVGTPDSGLRASDEAIGSVVMANADGNRVRGTVELVDAPQVVLGGLENGTMGFGMDGSGVVNVRPSMSGRSYLIEQVNSLRGINVVPVPGEPTTTITEGPDDPLELT